jgi:acyl-CoA thioesterase YciA
MPVEAEAWARDRRWDDANKVTETVFTFVAVGPDRRPHARATTCLCQAFVLQA